jgi:ribonuclease HI
MIDVYTDGSALGNPGPGGWACVGPGFELIGGEARTTNNIMEMTAVAHALEKCIDLGITEAKVHTDSTYVQKGITSWIHGWKKRGWTTSNGAPVKNRELWEKIDFLRDNMKEVEFKWVKAHAGNALNEKVDTLARNRATEIKKSLTNA